MAWDKKHRNLEGRVMASERNSVAVVAEFQHSQLPSWNSRSCQPYPLMVLSGVKFAPSGSDDKSSEFQRGRASKLFNLL